MSKYFWIQLEHVKNQSITTHLIVKSVLGNKFPIQAVTFSKKKKYYNLVISSNGRYLIHSQVRIHQYHHLQQIQRAINTYHEIGILSGTPV
jgi:hypothetical protein